MLHTEVRDRLQEIVDEKIKNGERFTAYDVTRQLRAESFWVRHDHARSAVHQLYQDGDMPGYARRLVQKGGPVPAWEYAPASSIPQALAGLASRLLFQRTPPGLRAPSSVRTYGAPRSQATLPSVGGLAVSLDARATVCVPARLVRHASLRPGDQVRVYIDTLHTQLVIRAACSATAPVGLPACRYTVDCHFNIRITRGPQLRAGLQGSRRAIQAQADQLVVKAA